MLRTSLFLMLTSMAGVVAAQTQDPLAAAPVQYDDGPAPQQTADNYDSQQRDDTVIDCGLDDEGRPLTCPDDQAGYTPDDEMAPADDAPLFAPDYYAYEDYQYHAPYPYYAGVSLWPDYYWPGYAWGWGGWGLGWGWPAVSIGFGWGWHGGWHHGWNNWHNGHAWHGRDHFHGPWRYDGHGHYADHRDYGRSNHFAQRGFDSRNFSSRNFANRNGERGYDATRGAHGFDGAQRRSFGANREGARDFDATRRFGGTRSSLPSASYYSRSRGYNPTQSFNRGNMQNTNRADFRGATQQRGSAYASRQYGSASRGQSSFANRNYPSMMQSQRTGAMPSRSFSQSTQRSFPGYQSARGASYGRPSYSPRQAYSGGRSSYSGGHSYAAPHVSAPSHSSGDGGSRGGSGGGHRH